MQESVLPPLVQIDTLEYLGIANPSRAVLDLLPGWLERVSGSLTQLHLDVSENSVPPPLYAPERF